MGKILLDWIAVILVVIGGLNWGLIGVLDFNLVTTIFGAIDWLVKVVYILVGIAALYTIYFALKK